MRKIHEWNLSPEEAVRLQDNLKARLHLKWKERPVRILAGVDVSVRGPLAHCAIVLLEYPSLTPLEGVCAEVSLVFPYIPGLLAFREGPAVLAAWQQLSRLPDVVMFDGQGIAHPRRMGIAAHMGLWLERPTIGIAKSRLYGHHTEVGPQRGDSAPLLDERGQVIGIVLRTRAGSKPVYISPGHQMDWEHALAFTLHCLRGYRLPEPTRWAHHLAGGGKLPSETGQQPALL